MTRNVGLSGGQSPSAWTEGAGIAAKLRLGDLAILGGPPGFAQALHFGRPNTAQELVSVIIPTSRMRSAGSGLRTDIVSERSRPVSWLAGLGLGRPVSALT